MENELEQELKDIVLWGLMRHLWSQKGEQPFGKSACQRFLKTGFNTASKVMDLALDKGMIKPSVCPGCQYVLNDKYKG